MAGLQNAFPFSRSSIADLGILQGGFISDISVSLRDWNKCSPENEECLKSFKKLSPADQVNQTQCCTGVLIRFKKCFGECRLDFRTWWFISWKHPYIIWLDFLENRMHLIAWIYDHIITAASKQKTADNVVKNGMVAPGKVFTFQELASATENFNPDLLVGEGAFGRVYKGRLKSTNQVRRPALFLFSQNLALSHCFVCRWWLWSSWIETRAKKAQNFLQRSWHWASFSTPTSSISLDTARMAARGYWFTSICRMDP